MKIADLDTETRRVIYLARVVHMNASAEHLAKLGAALNEWDKKHEQERTDNMLNALFGDVGYVRKERDGR